MRALPSICFWLFATAGGIADPALASADCVTLLERFNAAVAAGQLTEAKAIEAEVAGDAVCGGRLKDVQRRRAALQLTMVQQRLAAGAGSGDIELLLVDADQPEVLWQAAKALGDFRFGQRRFAQAATAFERSLEIIRNPSLTPRAPDKAAIRQIFDRAVQAKLLAGNEEDKTAPAIYVASVKDRRDGSPGGTLSEDIRGFRPQIVPLPIRFETASAVLSTVGSAAAGELAEALLSQKPQQVTIVGHTDERGADAYNLKLSEDRANAVKAFLEGRGVQAKITALAKGKSEPLQTSGTASLSREEIWSLNRRVEWRRD